MLPIIRNKLPHTFILILGFGLALLTVSCTSDPYERDTTPQGGPGERETAYISFKLDMARKKGDTAPSSRGTNDREREDYRVESARVVLYGPDDKVHYAFDFSIASNDNAQGPGFIEGESVDPDYGSDLFASSTSSDEAVGFVTYARKVEKSDYRMLVIINGAESGGIYDITNVGQDKSLLYEPVKREKSLASNPSVLMVNYQDLVEVKAEQLGASIPHSHENPVYARVERYLAKIIVTTYDAGGQIELLGDLANGEISAQGMRWAADCTNKWFYWMRKMAPMIEKDGTKGVLETVNYDPGTPVTSDTRLRMYAIDPNFDNLSTAKGGTPAQRRAQFDYLIQRNDFAGEKDLPNSFGPEYSEYVLENTMEPDEQYPEVMTKAVVQLRITPDKNIVNAGESYFTFEDNQTKKESVITLSAMRSYLADQNNIPANISGLKTAIANIRSEAQVDLPGAADGEETPGFDLHGLKFYYQGRHYFMIPIKHYSDYESSAPGGMEYGRYGVVRNNIYTVKIRSVSTSGSPSIGNPAFMSAEIGIAPWLKHSQQTDLGSDVEMLNSYITYEYYTEGDSDNIYLGCKYKRNVETGSPIETALHLNTMKGALMSGIYQDGEVLGAAPQTVSSDPARNVVKIIYRHMEYPGGAFLIYHIWWYLYEPDMEISPYLMYPDPDVITSTSVTLSENTKPTNDLEAMTASMGRIEGGKVFTGAESGLTQTLTRNNNETKICVIFYGFSF